MKRIFSLSATVLMAMIMLLSGCERDAGLTPDTDATELWPAGISQNTYMHKPVYGYINKNGRMVIKPIYHQAGTFSCGYAPVRYDSLVSAFSEDSPYYYNKYATTYKFINTHGKIHRITGLPENSYGTLSPFYNNAAVFQQSLPYGSMSHLIDNYFNVVTSLRGIICPMSADGLAAHYDNSYSMACEVDLSSLSYFSFREWNYYNILGEKVFSIYSRYSLVPNFIGGYTAYTRVDCNDKDTIDGKVSLHTPSHIINTKGEVVYEDEHVLQCIGNKIFARYYYDENGEISKREVIDIHGNLYGTPEFDAPALKEDIQTLLSYHDFKLYRNIYYYVNQTGEQTIPYHYVDAKDFNEGYAVVKYVDLNVTIETNEDYRNFENTISNTPYCLINKQGETILTFEPEEEVTSVHNGMVLTHKRVYSTYSHAYHTDTYKYINLSGKVVYSWVEEYINEKEVNSAQQANIRTQVNDADNAQSPDEQPHGGLKIYPNGLYVLGAEQ